VAGKARFLHVGFNWSGTPKTKELESLFNTALDWMRYAPNCWILWTTNNPETWAGYIKHHLGAKDEVIIAEINLAKAGDNYYGWEDKWIWDWIQKQR